MSGGCSGQALAEKLTIGKKGAAPQQIKQQVQAFRKKGMFKAEELEWSGLIEWLDEQKGRISRDELTEFLLENEVQIDETVAEDEGVDEVRWFEQGDIIEPGPDYIKEEAEYLSQSIRDELDPEDYEDQEDFESAVLELAEERVTESYYDYDAQVRYEDRDGEGFEIIHDRVDDTFILRYPDMEWADQDFDSFNVLS